MQSLELCAERVGVGVLQGGSVCAQTWLLNTINTIKGIATKTTTTTKRVASSRSNNYYASCHCCRLLLAIKNQVTGQDIHMHTPVFCFGQI